MTYLEATRKTPAIADDLPPEVQRRVRALITDLANDDLDLALLDFAHLYRALTQVPPVLLGVDREEAPEPIEALIYSDDGELPEVTICDGPDDAGRCPRADEGGHAACAGQWLMTQGWSFRVDPTTEACPLVSLGIVHRYLKRTAGRPASAIEA